MLTDQFGRPRSITVAQGNLLRDTVADQERE